MAESARGNSLRHPFVEERYVGKFIKAIRALQEQDRQQQKLLSTRARTGTAESIGDTLRRGNTSAAMASRINGGKSSCSPH